jgi:arylsulfatase A-like enzyme
MSTPHAAPTRRPNIIFIVADDLAYADLGCYGGRPGRFGAVSPHIDALAAGGLRFTQGDANSPVCSPTRFASMSMRWQYRLRGALDEPIDSRSQGSPTLGLPPEVPTLPGLLRQAGYRTALVGKWHLNIRGLTPWKPRGRRAALNRVERLGRFCYPARVSRT